MKKLASMTCSQAGSDSFRLHGQISHH